MTDNDMTTSIDDLFNDELPQPPLPQDILQEEVQEDIRENKNPVISLFGVEYDLDSTIVMFLIVFIWVFIWSSTGLYKTLKYDAMFISIFFIFIVYSILNVATSGTSSGGVVYELNILLTVEQMISILFGTMVLFSVFYTKLPFVQESCTKIIFRLNMSIIIILCTASLWVNLITSGRMFRAIRKFKQGVYNIALTLFMLIGLILFKGVQCAPKSV